MLNPTSWATRLDKLWDALMKYFCSQFYYGFGRPENSWCTGMRATYPANISGISYEKLLQIMITLKWKIAYLPKSPGNTKLNSLSRNIYEGIFLGKKGSLPCRKKINLGLSWPWQVGKFKSTTTSQWPWKKWRNLLQTKMKLVSG